MSGVHLLSTPFGSVWTGKPTNNACAGSLFFWTFELLVFMVLLNFLLAIIVDAFSMVKDNTSESTGLHEEIAQMMREKWRAMLGRMLNVHYIPSSRLSALLKHWAGSDSDGPKAKATAEEDQTKRIKVLDHELEEHALKEVLSEAMQNMLATAPELSPEDEPRGGCLGRKGGSRSANLSAAELDSAAKWLLERFGHEGGDDAEDSDADDDEVRYSVKGARRGRRHCVLCAESLPVLRADCGVVCSRSLCRCYGVDAMHGSTVRQLLIAAEASECISIAEPLQRVL